MIHLNIICVGKLKEKYLKDAIDEYSKRLGKYCVLKIIELQDESLPSKINESIIEDIKNKECKKILENIKSTSYVIALDLKGKQHTSEEFSQKIEEISVRGFSDITFIIGGSDGIGENIKNKCNFKLSFSKLTYPHGLFRLILLEQIYRSFKILNNESYHK